MATTERSTVVAVFRNASDAQSAANELTRRGLSASDIHISSESAGTGRTGVGITGAGTGDAYTETGAHHEGGFMGWWKSLFGSDDHPDQRQYESAVSRGNVALVVNTDERNADTVTEILNSMSPVDVHTEEYGAASGISTSNTENAGYPTPADETYRNRGTVAATTGSVGAKNTRPGAADVNTDQAIPVIEEELRVGKRAVQRGGVRVYSRVTEQPVEESVNLREEHVRVERQPVNRPVDEADLRGVRDQVIEVKEYAEEAVVAKEARVVEEVRVGKEVGERTQTVRDTVRRTDVEVENLGAGADRSSGNAGAYQAGTPGYDDTDFRSDFTRNYGSSGGSYDDYAPAYRFGYDAANDPRYQGRDYSSIESDLRNDYSARYPNSNAWDKVKNSVRYGWDKVTGKTRSATTR